MTITYVNTSTGQDEIDGAKSVEVVKGALWVYDPDDDVIAVYPRDYWSSAYFDVKDEDEDDD